MSTVPPSAKPTLIESLLSETENGRRALLAEKIVGLQEDGGEGCPFNQDELDMLVAALRSHVAPIDRELLAELEVELHNATQSIEYGGDYYATKNGPLNGYMKRALAMLKTILHSAPRANVAPLNNGPSTGESPQRVPEARGGLTDPHAAPRDTLEWIWHLDLHLTEHDLQHAGKALRAAWPHVRKYLTEISELAGQRSSTWARKDLAESLRGYADELRQSPNWSAHVADDIVLAADLLMTEAAPPSARAARIVVLCGSTKFKQAFERATFEESLAGKVVLSVACHTQAEGIDLADEDKEKLDALHRQKIDLADEVLILNVGGYIGESTAAEIEYANARGKTIRYLKATESGRA